MPFPAFRSVRLLLVAAAFMLTLVVSPPQAHADFQLCNNTGSRVGVAVGYKDTDGSWVTEGWWNLSARSCEPVLKGAPGIAALAGDTDGTDGGAGSPDDPAGAAIDATTLQRARWRGLDPAHFLADNDSTGFFSRLGDLVETGPTWTNVNDFRAIVVDRP